MITVDDLKKLEWKFTMHADGGDKRGRFSINFASAEFRGEKIEGWKKVWRAHPGVYESGYRFRDMTFPTLASIAQFINKATDVGDETRGVGNDD